MQPSSSDQDAEESEQEGECSDPELAAFASRVLQRRVEPGTRLTAGSLQLLSQFLDTLTHRVLEEARRISGEAAGASAGGAAAADRLTLTSLDIHKVGTIGPT